MNDRGLSPAFSVGQGQPWRDRPFLGGFAFVLKTAVGAGGTVAIAHPLRVPPRHVEVIALAQPAVYPSRVAFSPMPTSSTATVIFESAQPIGTVVWLW